MMWSMSRRNISMWWNLFIKNYKFTSYWVQWLRNVASNIRNREKSIFPPTSAIRKKKSLHNKVYLINIGLHLSVNVPSHPWFDPSVGRLYFTLTSDGKEKNLVAKSCTFSNWNQILPEIHNYGKCLSGNWLWALEHILY